MSDINSFSRTRVFSSIREAVILNTFFLRIAAHCSVLLVVSRQSY
jgi:hypothetical protein